MALSIDYLTRIISVPKADLTLIQSTPFEILELDINAFRLELKDIEDNVGGMPFVDTHRHFTTVTVGGVTLARVVEIINGYTVTFEDGNYAVNLVGANSNIGDVLNLNQVQVRSSNSAGLAQPSVSEYASFNGGVWIDTASTQTGTVYPAGTEEFPVNNLADAIIIAEARGFSRLNFASDFTFGATDSISNYELVGRGEQRTTFTFTSGCSLNYCEAYDAEVTGTVDGIVGFTNCTVNGLGSAGLAPSSEDVLFQNCYFKGTTTVPSNYSGTFTAVDCWALPDASDNSPVIDMGDSTADFQLRNWSGLIDIQNNTNANDVRIFFASGGVELDSTVTAGNFYFSGVGTLTNNSTSVTSLEVIGLVNREAINDVVFDEVYIDTASSNTGTAFPVGTVESPVNNLADAILIAAEHNTTTFYLLSAITIASGENISGYTFKTSTRREVTLTSGCITFYTAFIECGVTGVPNGYLSLERCSIDGLNGFYGTMEECTQNGTLTISSDNTKNAVIVDLRTGNVAGPPTIDCNGDGAKLSLRGLTGAALITNKTGSTQPMFIDLYSARVGFNNTVTAGNITVRGVGYIYQDDSTGTTFDTQGLISTNTVADQVWEELQADHTTAGTMGKALSDAGASGNPWSTPVSGNTTPGSFGELVGKKLLTIAKFLGLK